jgi:hypothetical protein
MHYRMRNKSGAGIDSLIALQKMLDIEEPMALRGTGLSANNRVLTRQRINPINQESATLRDKATYALQVLGLLEFRCEMSLQVAASLMRVQRRLRTGANSIGLIATGVVVSATAFDQPRVAMVAAILASLAIGAAIMSEHMIMTRKSDRVGPQAAHARLSRIVSQIQAARIELQTLLRYDVAALGLGGAINNANALCAQIMKDTAALITDPDGRTLEDVAIPVPPLA